MHRVKLLGQHLMSREFDLQVAELQVCIAVLNGYTALTIPVTEAVGQVYPGKWNPGHQFLCAATPAPIHQTISKRKPT